MLGLGSHVSTDEGAVVPDTLSLIPHTSGGLLFAEFLTAFTVTETGASTGTVGANNVGGKLHVQLGSVQDPIFDDMSDQTDTTTEGAVTGIDAYIVVTNLRTGKQAEVGRYDCKYTDANSLALWRLGTNTWADTKYDEVRSDTTESTLNPVAVTSSATPSDKTSVPVEFSGCYSDGYGLTFLLKSSKSGAQISCNTEFDFVHGFLAGSGVQNWDGIFPTRSTYSGDNPAPTKTYVDIELLVQLPADVDDFTLVDVPVWKTGDDAFAILDVDGAQMDFTGTFKWRNKDGVLKSADLSPLGSVNPASFTFKIVVDVEGTTSTRDASVQLLLTT